jgi:DNA-binding response OmpR family regulator
MARVLIVQGHARSRADTAATLRAEGHEVLEAGSADNGVRLVHEQGPEVILLDPMLPDRSGYELYASLQCDPVTVATNELSRRRGSPRRCAWPARQTLGWSRRSTG